MLIAESAQQIIEKVRAEGKYVDLITVSPDVYLTLERQNNGIEPKKLCGVEIQIRDNYMPGTFLLLGPKVVNQSIS